MRDIGLSLTILVTAKCQHMGDYVPDGIVTWTLLSNLTTSTDLHFHWNLLLFIFSGVKVLI